MAHSPKRLRSAWRVLVPLLLLGSGPVAAADTPATASVELTPSQLQAIHIGPVKTMVFLVEREAPGSVSFDLDPALAPAQAGLVQAAAQADVAAKERQRAAALAPSHGVSDRELEQAIADDRVAQANLMAARSALLALGATELEVRALEQAGGIQPSAAPTGKAWVSAWVTEDDAPLLHVGQPATVSLAALPGRSFAGVVRALYAAVDQTSHRRTVRCLVADPDHALLPGMMATVAIEVEPGRTAVALPANGLVREGDGTWTAWVTTDRRHFQQRQVDPGLRQAGMVEVRHGLVAGEQAVTDGALLLDNILNAPPGDD